MIDKTDLIEGRKYKGYCRNADIALWKGGMFHIKRKKFGAILEETLPTYEDRIEPWDYFEPEELLEETND